MRFCPVCAERLLIVFLAALCNVSYGADLRWDCHAAEDGADWKCHQYDESTIVQKTVTAPPPKITNDQLPNLDTETKTAGTPAHVTTPVTAAPTALAEDAATLPPTSPVEPASESGTDYHSLLDEGIDWNQCGLVQDSSTSQKVTDEEIINIDADSAVTDLRKDTIQFSGSVVLTRAGQTVYSEDLSYDSQSGQLTSLGNIFLQREDLRITGNNLLYHADSSTGSLSGVHYRIPGLNVRGEASVAQLTGKNTAHYEQITYTTCPPDNSDFILSAESMDIDRATSIGTFKGAKLSFLGVPLFYVPKMTLPLDDKRKSGLLPPTLGYSSKNGADITLPYYFNLAPNYDATLYPRLLSERGVALGGEFRFLGKRHKGEILAEVLPDDRLYENGGSRGAAQLNTRSILAPNLSGSLKLNYVSDVDYLDDLGDSLVASSTRFLQNRARLDYHSKNWDFYAELKHYKTLDESIAEENRPYSQLPGLRLDYLQHDGPGGISYSLLSEYIYFYKEDDTRGHRLDLMPGASLPIGDTWWYIEPAASARYTRYALSNQPAGLSNTHDRSLYSLSLDSGMLFDRTISWQNHTLTQTLEPRAYYLYTPYREQDDLPVFDTGLLDFNFDNLFRDNRFNGPDRVGDANQLTLALSTTLLSQENGSQLMRASIGQIFYFDDQQVTLPGEEITDYSHSSFLAQISGSISDWQLRAGVQLDPNTSDDQLQQALAQATYRGKSGQLFNAAYRLRDKVVEQTDMAVIWPLSANTSMIGRWYYSLQEDKTLEAVAGLEYGRCCWKIRAVLRHYLDSDGTEYNNSAMIQLELNGLGKLGNDIDQYLDRAIYGY